MQIDIFHDWTYDRWQPARAYGWQTRDGERITGYHYHAAPDAETARALARQSADLCAACGGQHAIQRCPTVQALLFAPDGADVRGLAACLERSHA